MSNECVSVAQTTDAAAQEAAHEIVGQGATTDTPSTEHVLTRLADRGVDREQARRALQALLATGDIEIGEDGVTVAG